MWVKDGENYYAIVNEKLLTLRKSYIMKGNGKKFRKIFISNKQTKKFFRQLLNSLYAIHQDLCDNLDIPHGFIKERSALTNAIQHKKIQNDNTLNLTISLDIEDFFCSIKPSHVDFLGEELIKICFIENELPQGLPTSPIISNIAMIKIDNLIKTNLASLADSKKFNYIYTRYADDITVSITNYIYSDLSMIKKIQRDIIKIIRAVLLINNLKLNDKKTRYARFSDAVNVTGVNIYGSNVSPTRYTKRKLRAACHSKNFDSILGLINWIENIYAGNVKKS